MHLSDGNLHDLYLYPKSISGVRCPAWTLDDGEQCRKAHDGEQCRKQWERLRRQLSRFAGIYQNNLRNATSDMTAENVKRLSHQQYPDSQLGFKEFNYWEVYLEVQNSPKFVAGVELADRSGRRSPHSGHTTAVAVPTTSPTPRQSSRALDRLPAAVAWLGKSLRCRWLGGAVAGPSRSNRQLLPKLILSSPHLPAWRIMRPWSPPWRSGKQRLTPYTRRC